MRDAFPIDLKLRHFFDLPTIADLADAIEALGGKPKDEDHYGMGDHEEQDTKEMGII